MHSLFEKETDYVERAGSTNDLSAKEEESTESHDDSTALASAGYTSESQIL